MARSTVAEALKALEWAGVLTWQHRITRILVRERDLFGQWASRWRVIRTSNAYVFSDPKPQLPASFTCKSENPPGTQNQEILDPETDTRMQPERPSGTCLKTIRSGDRRKTALNKRAAGRSKPPDQWQVTASKAVRAHNLPRVASAARRRLDRVCLGARWLGHTTAKSPCPTI